MHKLFIAVVGTTLLTGCPDTEGEFCAFDQRYKDAKLMGAGRDKCESAAVVPTECESCDMAPVTPAELGDFMFALSTNIAPTLPILFDAQPTVELDGTDTSFTMVLQPLHAMDRVPIDQPFTIGPFPLEGGYCLLAELDQIDVPGEANPISGNPVSAVVTLQGSFCDPGDFFCGTIPTGQALVGGAMLDLGGAMPSTWTIERLSAPGMYPAMPKLSCEDAP